MELITTSIAARTLGVSENTVRLWHKTGRLPAAQTAGRIRLFDPSYVVWLASEMSKTNRPRNGKRTRA